MCRIGRGGHLTYYGPVSRLIYMVRAHTTAATTGRGSDWGVGGGHCYLQPKKAMVIPLRRPDSAGWLLLSVYQRLLSRTYWQCRR